VTSQRLVRVVFQTLRAGVAGLAATAIDLATLAILVSGFHVSPHVANVPALVVGGVANFVGNRHFAFRAQRESIVKQAIGYTLVEIVALALNGFLFELALRTVPNASHAYALIRLATSHIVFLLWSYPLWCFIFRRRRRGQRDLRGASDEAVDAA
jgi:putative flippase GtrA